MKDGLYTADEIDDNLIDKEEIKDFILTNNNGIVNITEEGIVIAKTNTAREKITIQNNGLEPVLIKINGTATEEDYDFIIKASTRKNLGDGGTFVSDTMKLSIHGITLSGESIVSVLEEVNV